MLFICKITLGKSMLLISDHIISCKEENTCSRELTEPITLSLVSLEGLFTELLVATVLDSVEFETVRVRVDKMVLGEHVRHGVEHSGHTEHHQDNKLVIRDLLLAEVSNVLCDIVSHLRGR